MPSPLVDRYALHFVLEEGRVVEPFSRATNLLMAVEGCLSTYRSTGHWEYAIRDLRKERAFHLNRTLLLRFLFLKTYDEARYFEILNRLDVGGDQEELDAYLSRHATL